LVLKEKKDGALYMANKLQSIMQLVMSSRERNRRRLLCQKRERETSSPAGIVNVVHLKKREKATCFIFKDSSEVKEAVDIL